MKFADFSLDDALGVVLAHSVRVGGTRLPKGRRLGEKEIGLLREAGFDRIPAVRLEPGDVPEDEAAGTVAASLAHDSLSVDAASNGRVNVRALAGGLCLVDAGVVHAMNAVDESVTIATVPPCHPVAAGEIVTTVKIIPFAAPRTVLDAVTTRASGRVALRVAPFVKRRVGIVFSELPEVPFRGRDKALRVLGDRLAALDNEPGPVEICRHEPEAIANAVGALLARGCDLLLLFGASAIVDRGDVIPSGLVRAGGAVDYFGMPVEPGNMLLLGRVGEVPAVGLPGCARSPALNGFDWVLQRLCAGVPVAGADLAAMGVGGLLRSAPPER